MADARKKPAQRKSQPDAVGLIQQFAHRYRYQLAPLYAIALVIFLGAVAHESPKDGWLWIVCTSAIVAAVFLFTRKWLDRNVERVYAAVSITLSTLWLLAAWKWGVTQPLAIVAAVVGVLLGIPWWAHFRIRAPKKPRAKGAHKAALNDLAEKWEERVAGGETPFLKGSYLTDVRKIKHGVEARIVMPPGVLSTEDAVKSTKRIASAFEVPLSAVSIEAYRGGVANQAKLIIIDDDPLTKALTFPGPSLREDGSFDLGTYVDGETATMRLWRPKFGAVHTLLAGTTGAGKSGVYNVVLANATSSRLVTTWILDPQGGQSMPEWMDHVDWAARSTEEGLIMLEAAKAVMDERSRHFARMEWTDDEGNARRGRGYFEPTEDMPLLTLVIDEAHALLSDQDAVKMVADLAKQARKCGIQLLLATQVPSVEELGGNSTIRDQVASGTAVVLRTQSSRSANMVFSGAMPVKPSEIPSEMSDGSTSAGLGFTMGSNTRTAMMRTYYVSDKQAYALAREAHPRPLDAMSAAAAGLAYAARPKPESAPEPGNPVPVVEAPKALPLEPGESWFETDEPHDFGPPWPDGHDPDSLEETEDDALYEEAKELVTTTGYVSSQMLGRKLRVGHAVANRLVDVLHREGVIEQTEDGYTVVDDEPEPEPVPELPPVPTTAVEAVYAGIVRMGGEAKMYDLRAELQEVYSVRAIAEAAKKLVADGRLVKPRNGYYVIPTTSDSDGDTTS